MEYLFDTFNGTTVPETTTKVINGCAYVDIHYVLSENNGIYTWKIITLKKSEYTYSGLVNALIGLSYNLRETLAILNNYMDDPENPKYKKEFKELQEVRKAAKAYAKKHFNL